MSISMNALATKLKQTDKGLIVAIFLFFTALPLVWQINFSQNDDWVYYQMVQNFMHGNFALDPVSAPTFYFQGLAGAIFSLVFGLSRLPVLTLLVSVVNFYLLFKILTASTKLGTKLSLIFSLIWFFNPLNVYSSLGFMTENYLLFCILVSLHFFNFYIVDKKPKHFFLFNLFLFLGLMTKQSALVLAISYPVYFLVNKKRRFLKVQTLISTLLFAFYFLVFPKTVEMSEKPLQFHHFYDYDYLIQLVKTMIIYVSAFCFPFLLLLLFQIKNFRNRKFLIVTLFAAVASLLLYFFVFKDFKPSRLAWQEFFYLDNTLERLGFYSRGIAGTKYYFKGIYDLYRYWDIIAKFFAGFVVVGLIMSLRKIKSQAHLVSLFLSYFLLMIVAEKVFDRYLPPLFLFFILIMSANYNPAAISVYIRRLSIALFVPFLAFLMFYSYQLSMDFVLANNYVWSQSLQIVKKENIDPKLIKGTNGWKFSKLNIGGNYLYEFTYDNAKVNKVYSDQYNLIEKHKVDFPGSIFVDPYIYLYKKRNFGNIAI